jgi:hypothetical protein
MIADYEQNRRMRTAKPNKSLQPDSAPDTTDACPTAQTDEVSLRAREAEAYLLSAGRGNSKKRKHAREDLQRIAAKLND